MYGCQLRAMSLAKRLDIELELSVETLAPAALCQLCDNCLTFPRDAECPTCRERIAPTGSNVLITCIIFSCIPLSAVRTVPTGSPAVDQWSKCGVVDQRWIS